ncbi:BRCT domain protein [Diplocarpon rosae]|nr:BRCT domain protein [Diplocarpon rosae]
MFRTVHVAEKAAIESDNQEYDTQQCIALQGLLLPSSSAERNPYPNTHTPNLGASSDAKFASAKLYTRYLAEVQYERDSKGGYKEDEGRSEDINFETPHRHVDVGVEDGKHKADLQAKLNPRLSPTKSDRLNPQLPFENVRKQPAGPKSGIPYSSAPSQAKLLYRRDSKGRLRPCTTEGQEYNLSDFYQRLKSERIRAMDESTQISSMSLTQENPAWVNDQYNIQEVVEIENPSNDTPEDEDPPAEQPFVSHDRHVPRTQSTACTYEENDTGHVALDFNPESESIDGVEEHSQDASYAPVIEHNSHSFEPKTPAPPVNPFHQKGSVMKGFELFDATQPSSIGRHMASPTSSRPSPDVHNDYSSPPKHKTPFVPSSPLGGLHDVEEPGSEFNNATPLQSSVRNILSRSLSAGNSRLGFARDAQALNTGPRSFQNPEPRAYVSMKESQERRQSKQADVESESSGSGDDSDIELIPRNKKREQQINREIASVAPLSRKRMSSSVPRSSVPRSSAPPSSIPVEVPSTGRRRGSIEEAYIAQCTGQDVRDTQDREVIADSQANGLHTASSPLCKPTPTPAASQRLLHPRLHAKVTGPEAVPVVAGVEPEGRAPDDEDTEKEEEPALEALSSEPVAETGLSRPDHSAPEPSLPLQKMPNNLRTPNKEYDTVPETSPIEGLRLMREIASISFSERDDDSSLLDNLPGFTPDVDFDTAMKIKTSPRPPPPKTSSLRRQASSNVSKAASSPIVSRGISNISSSALSSVPSSIVEPVQELVAKTADQSESQISDPVEQFQVQTQEESRGLDQAFEVALKGRSEEIHKKLPEHVSGDAIVGLLSEEPPEAGRGETAASSTPGAGNDPLDEVTKLLTDTSGELPVPSAATCKSLSKKRAKSGRTATTNLSLASSIVTKVTATSASFTTPNTASKATPRSTAAANPEIPAEVSTAKKPVTKAAAKAASKPQKATMKAATTAASALQTPANSTPSALAKRTTKRKTALTGIEEVLPTRSSKRQSIVKDSSPDPLALSSPSTTGRGVVVSALFKKMTFAVSYVSNEHEKDDVTKLILENGGRILPDGFDSLFEAAHPAEDLALSSSAKTLGFTALIADEHSRKAKYMQALALGLPCVSGHWITACVAKSSLVDWSPYLLCAGQSSILGNAHKSRILQPYPAAAATLENVFANRDKLLDGKSVLLITGKGKAQDRRKAYSFLARALGPARVGQVVDYQEARKKLSDEQEWDLLYVDTHEEVADMAVFGTPGLVSSSASRKRKRGPTPAVVDDSPAPKRIRIISDETMIQSLILGRLLDG